MPETTTLRASESNPPSRPSSENPGRLHRSAFRRYRVGQVLALAVVVVAIPLVVKNNFYIDIVVTTTLLACGSLAWNLLGGYAGQLSFGHAAFFGAGAYTTMVLYNDHSISPWIGMVVGGLVAATLGLAIGALTMRLRGPFFVLSTIALAQILLILAIDLDGLTGGSAGLSATYKPGFVNMTFADRGHYIWLSGALLVILVALSTALERWRLGFHARAVKDNLDAAESLGINGVAMKLRLSALSAFFTGVTGALVAMYIAYIDPTSYLGVNRSVEFVLVAIIGGIGTVWGPILGAILIETLQVCLRGSLGDQSAGAYLVIYGALMIIVVLFMPRGLAGGLQDMAGMLRRRKVDTNV